MGLPQIVDRPTSPMQLVSPLELPSFKFDEFLANVAHLLCQGHIAKAFALARDLT